MPGSRIGTIVADKYEVIGLLGAGGMGEVYEARHRELARRVALKFLLPGVACEPAVMLRFVNEARAAGRLEHENIAAVYDVGEAEDSSRFIVMQFLEGRDCDRELAAEGRLAPSRAVDLILQACRGLAVAHARGIVHRDLKPANLFLSPRADGSDLLRILDFGIAKLRPLFGDKPQAAGTPIGAILGTPSYMSPEQAEGHGDIDERTDVYALGAILYELLSGQRPFVGDTPWEVLLGILTTPPPPLASVNPALSADLCRLVHRAMARTREQRFANVIDLAAALIPFCDVKTAHWAAATEREGAPRLAMSSVPMEPTQSGTRVYKAVLDLTSPPSAAPLPISASAPTLEPTWRPPSSREQDRRRGYSVRPIAPDAPTVAPLRRDAMHAGRAEPTLLPTPMPPPMPPPAAASPRGRQPVPKRSAVSATAGAPHFTEPRSAQSPKARSVSLLLGAGLALALILVMAKWDTSKASRLSASDPTIPAASPQSACDPALSADATKLCRACVQGEASSCTRLGRLYERGDGTPWMPKRAVELYEQGCERNDATACTRLGVAYEHGYGVLKDVKHAAAFYEQACKGGDQDGCTSLRRLSS